MRTTKYVVLAMSSKLEASVYGPFPTPEEADLWKISQEQGDASADLDFVVLPLLPARVTVRGTVNRR